MKEEIAHPELNGLPVRRNARSTTIPRRRPTALAGLGEMSRQTPNESNESMGRSLLVCCIADVMPPKAYPREVAREKLFSRQEERSPKVYSREPGKGRPTKATPRGSSNERVSKPQDKSRKASTCGSSNEKVSK